MMLMTAVEEDGEAGIDVQVQRMMQSQAPRMLLYFLFISLYETAKFKAIDRR